MSFVPADPRAVFGPAAERYATSAVHSDPAALARLVEIAKPSVARVLDVATGSGHTAIAFAPFVAQVVASDFTPDMLKVCRREARARGIENLTVCLAQAEVLPFRDGSFDGVTARLAPHHFQSVDAFLSESHRVLRPGGWLLVSDTVGPEDQAAREGLDEMERLRDPSHVSDLSVSNWKARLASAGFRLEIEEGYRKTLDARDWMERLSVPAEVQSQVEGLIEGAEGELKEYLCVARKGGRLQFELREHVFLSVK